MAQPKKRDPWKQALECRTLAQAHEVLGKLVPAPDAAASRWKAFYEHSARVYERVAEVDRGHHHEAMYWAKREGAKAEEVGSDGR